MSSISTLRDLHGIEEACEKAEDAVRALRMHPVLFRASTSEAKAQEAAKVRAELELRAACASAELDGASWERDTPDDVEAVRAGVVTDQRVQSALRCYAELPTLIPVWRRAPLQALARLHVLAASGVLETDQLGRPQTKSAEVLALAQLVVTERAAPALLVGAVVHGELLRLAPFGAFSGLIARAAARLACAARGLDPQLEVAVELVHVEREPEYVGAAAAYGTGRTDGVRAWLKHCAVAYQRGASRSAKQCEAGLAVI